MPTRRCHRATWAGVGVVLLVQASLPQVAGAAAADDLASAQRRADRAAGKLATALEEIARADDIVAHLEIRVARVEARVAAVRGQVAQLAVRQYVQGTVRLTRLLRMANANEVVRAQQFAGVIADTSTESLERYRADKEDLRIELAALQGERKARSATLADLRQRQDDAVQELERLAELEARAEVARAEQGRVAASTATTAAEATIDTPAPPAAQVDASRPTTSAAAPSTTPTTRAPAPPPAAAAADWICPVQGARAFSNDYGAPRGGGSSHMGNDILSPRGTPVVANVSGVVTQRNGAVSGLAYFLAGDDGNRYFGAHLDSFGAGGRVTAGTQIGTVGNTGDASGGPPHLHFEMHPGGSGYTNPYTTLKKYC